MQRAGALELGVTLRLHASGVSGAAVRLPATSTDTSRAPVAQGTERRTSNPRAGGSNPPRRTTAGHEDQLRRRDILFPGRVHAGDLRGGRRDNEPEHGPRRELGLVRGSASRRGGLTLRVVVTGSAHPGPFAGGPPSVRGEIRSSADGMAVGWLRGMLTAPRGHPEPSVTERPSSLGRSPRRPTRLRFGSTPRASRTRR